MLEVTVEIKRLRDIEGIREDQRLALRVALIRGVVLDHRFAPDKRIAGVVPRAIEKLAEIHVEVFQERLQTVDIRQRDPEVSPVLFRPHIETERLAVAESGAERLAGLQVFVRHRSHRRYVR